MQPSGAPVCPKCSGEVRDGWRICPACLSPLADLRSGTPAYMSPEQKAGKEVTTRSHLYSLGLVLYEMFTGKRRTNTETNPTDLVKDLNPAVERVILRWLEEDPKRRPSSALNVAMALPGGDPIAAALAAGETPSPEMVSASGEKEGFSPRTHARDAAAAVAAEGMDRGPAHRCPARTQRGCLGFHQSIPVRGHRGGVPLIRSRVPMAAAPLRTVRRHGNVAGKLF